MYTRNGLERSICILVSGVVGYADPTAISTPKDDNEHPPNRPLLTSPIIQLLPSPFQNGPLGKEADENFHSKTVVEGSELLAL